MLPTDVLRKKMQGGGEEDDDLVPSRLEQALANMVEKVIARQRLGQCKAQVRNQSTMEARDALRKSGLGMRNALDEEDNKAMLKAFKTEATCRTEAQIATLLRCFKIMRCLDDFSLPDMIMEEILQHMEYECLSVRDRVIMEGDEMDGVFKLCLSGILQSDIDEYKNAVYLETGEYFCEDHLRATIKTNPEPLVMMVAKQETHLVTVKPEHYLMHMAPYLEREYEWKKSYLSSIELFNGYSESKLAQIAAVAGKVSWRAGEAIVQQGNTGLKRYSDTYDGIFFILKGEVAVFKQVEPPAFAQNTDQAGKQGRLAALTEPRKSHAVPLSPLVDGRRDSGSDCSKSKRTAAEKRAAVEERKKKKAEQEKHAEKEAIEAKNRRRTSIAEASRALSLPTPEAAPPPVKPPPNKMGGKGQLYENMLMPLDDMAYGPELKLATLTMLCSELQLLLEKDEVTGEYIGLEKVRRGSRAVVMLPNPADYERNASVHVYVKGHPAEVDRVLAAIRAELDVSSIAEVNPYAPASLVMPVAPEHVQKVRGIMLDVASQTTTEVCFTSARCTALRIVGREGDCNRALEMIQSQLDKKMWTVQTETKCPGQSFGESAYMEGDHPHHEGYMQGGSSSSKAKGTVWKHQSIIALTHVDCLVLTANDFGDIITMNTHRQVSDTYHNFPTDGSLRKTLQQYEKWDKYKSTLVGELHEYYQDPMNFGLPVHMPEIKDDTHGNGYLHMYVDRKGPEKRKVHKTKTAAVESMHPPKIGVDHFTNK